MDVMKKLVELLADAGLGKTDRYFLADCLIANGVTVQELALPEEEYYVLRNAETGMYFRGKGVNRWGKHFNQATIYRVKGTAEHSIKEVAWHGEKAELVRIKIVELPQPPKGENETIFCKNCENLMFSDCYGECSKGYKGIVKPNDTCKYATRKLPKGE